MKFEFSWQIFEKSLRYWETESKEIAIKWEQCVSETQDTGKREK
jgi:hypothetical protein